MATPSITNSNQYRAIKSALEPLMNKPVIDEKRLTHPLLCDSEFFFSKIDSCQVSEQDREDAVSLISRVVRFIRLNSSPFDPLFFTTVNTLVTTNRASLQVLTPQDKKAIAQAALKAIDDMPKPDDGEVFHMMVSGLTHLIQDGEAILKRQKEVITGLVTGLE